MVQLDFLGDCVCYRAVLLRDVSCTQATSCLATNVMIFSPRTWAVATYIVFFRWFVRRSSVAAVGVWCVEIAAHHSHQLRSDSRARSHP